MEGKTYLTRYSIPLQLRGGITVDRTPRIARTLQNPRLNKSTFARSATGKQPWNTTEPKTSNTSNNCSDTKNLKTPTFALNY